MPLAVNQAAAAVVPNTVTLLIHGTFASDSEWWRFGEGADDSFADRLVQELAQRGMPGTVWHPALAAGLDYASFAWSGRNRHRDRIDGARRLSASINDLADRLGATATKPLTLNCVAHSHGGNVLLEALRAVRSNVRLGRMALLGTPLITAKPSFRLGRFVLSTVLLSLLFGALLVLVVQLGAFVYSRANSGT